MTPAKIPVTEREQHDVPVVGGGIAGISAAVSAARAGADVLRGHDLLLREGKTLGRCPKPRLDPSWKKGLRTPRTFTEKGIPPNLRTVKFIRYVCWGVCPSQ